MPEGDSLEQAQLIWEEQRKADKARRRRERRALLGRFLLVAVLLVITIAISTLFANMVSLGGKGL